MIAVLILGVLTVYAAVGVVFSAAFAGWGVERVDPVARHSPLGFRLLILPGAAALWPLLLVRWWKAAKP